MSPRRRRRRWWVYDRPLWRDRLVWIAAAIGVADAVEQLVRPDAPSMRGVSVDAATYESAWHTEGRRLAATIQVEVGPSYRVEYVP
jgi:hypothetical protein